MASTTNMARRKRNTDINIGDILQDVMWKGKENSILWQYGLWSFQTVYIKLERFLPKNQNTQRKLFNFENCCSGKHQFQRFCPFVAFERYIGNSKNSLISYFCNMMFTGIMCFLDYCCTIFP